jgi:LacI family transcriptional regulator
MVSGGVAARDVQVERCEVSRQGGYDAVGRLIERGPAGIDALVAANDLIAVGALAACRAAGMKVPDRLSVTGFDDIDLATDVTPRLTTVEIPFARIGAEAIRLAVSGAAAGREPVREVVQGRLVARASTRRRNDAEGTRFPSYV